MICTDGHFSWVRGSDASFSGCGEETRDGRTSLGAGAAEGSNGAQEDNEGHKSSHSNADDHRHWERLCREQQKEASCDHSVLHTPPVDMNRVCTTARGQHADPCVRPPFFFRTHYTLYTILSLQQTRTKRRVAVFFILLSDIIPQAQGHAIKTRCHRKGQRSAP